MKSKRLSNHTLLSKVLEPNSHPHRKFSSLLKKPHSKLSSNPKPPKKPPARPTKPPSQASLNLSDLSSRSYLRLGNNNLLTLLDLTYPNTVESPKKKISQSPLKPSMPRAKNFCLEIKPLGVGVVEENLLMEYENFDQNVFKVFAEKMRSFYERIGLVYFTRVIEVREMECGGKGGEGKGGKGGEGKGGKGGENLKSYERIFKGVVDGMKIPYEKSFGALSQFEIDSNLKVFKEDFWRRKEKVKKFFELGTRFFLDFGENFFSDVKKKLDFSEEKSGGAKPLKKMQKSYNKNSGNMAKNGQGDFGVHPDGDPMISAMENLNFRVSRDRELDSSLLKPNSKPANGDSVFQFGKKSKSLDFKKPNPSRRQTGNSSVPKTSKKVNPENYHMGLISKGMSGSKVNLYDNFSNSSPNKAPPTRQLSGNLSN